MEKFFKLKEHGTDVKTEVIAGITTFLTMAYILIVNPLILSETGMDFGAVFTATALASLIATLVMALVANLPLCTCTWYGTECFFCLCRLPWYGLFLGIRSHSRTPGRYYFYNINFP